MKTDKIINQMKAMGLNMACELLKSKLREGQVSIIIQDTDDDAYEFGLADFLQNNTKWVNRKNSFQAYFNDDSIKETCDYGGLC